jgi:hypothetical protein
MTARWGRHALLLTGLALTSACAATRVDYAPYRSHMPRSILVLPPRNESTNVSAPYVYLSTVTRPLSECGYYVFPVAVIDAFMKDNGLPTPDEMHGVSLSKIKEVIGPDAVLYVTIEDWGQKYVVVSSTTVVKARARLVDVATGSEIWTGTEHIARGSGGGENGLIGILVSALVNQIVASMSDPTHDVSREATNVMVFDPATGLLFGPHHPKYETDTRGR